MMPRIHLNNQNKNVEFPSLRRRGLRIPISRLRLSISRPLLHNCPLYRFPSHLCIEFIHRVLIPSASASFNSILLLDGTSPQIHTSPHHLSFRLRCMLVHQCLVNYTMGLFPSHTLPSHHCPQRVSHRFQTEIHDEPQNKYLNSILCDEAC